jgi:bifunctional UDP-N-acetylglucosamine pyrophosphorylase/glucosamine-1-phosphate N-acetyltransferase
MVRADNQVACQTRHAIILAAGESTRTRPLTLHRPKPLISLLGKPLLAHILDELVGLVDHVTLVVGYRAEDIQNRFGTSYRNMCIHYVHQNQINGTAGALLVVEEQSSEAGVPSLNEPFFLLYGDNLVSQVDLLGVCQHRYGMAGLRVGNPSSFGVLDIVENRVQRIIEKPTNPPPDALINPGIYHFDGAVFPALRAIQPSPRGEYELTDLIAALAREHTVGYHACQGHWIPVGNPWDVLVASMFLLERNAHLHPDIHPDISLDDCEISGWVHVGQAIIGSRCRIIGPAFIGNGVVVGPGSTIERSVLETGSAIGDHCTIRDSVLGPVSRVGMRCVVQQSLFDTSASMGAHNQLPSRLFDDIQPSAHTLDLLTHETLSRRGIVAGPGVVVPGGSTLEAGTVLFPD